MKISVYGPGCVNCEKLAENAKKAAEALGIEVNIEKVEDLSKMTEAGVFNTPGLSVDGDLKVTGRVPDVEEIKEILS